MEKITKKANMKTISQFGNMIQRRRDLRSQLLTLIKEHSKMTDGWTQRKIRRGYLHDISDVQLAATCYGIMKRLEKADNQLGEEFQKMMENDHHMYGLIEGIVQDIVSGKNERRKKTDAKNSI